MSTKIQVVDGITDGRQVADNFARHFGAACSNQSDTGARGLAEKYKSLRADYVGSPHLEEFDFDTELLDDILSCMQRGKAADYQGLSTEHFLYSHSVLSCVLAEFFNLIIHAGYVPSQFGISYTVPLLEM